MALNLLEHLPRRVGLLGVEKATLAYTLFTTLLILLLWGRMTDPSQLVHGRVLVVAGLVATRIIYMWMPTRGTLLLRYLYPLSLLAYWYPDTYEFCQIFGNLDHVFAAADQALFGCQPALAFYTLLPGKVWSELFHLGYFSYYPLIALTVLAPLFTDRCLFGRTAFVVLVSFFLYYLIYLFLPVAGPQYYFHAIGLDAVRAGHFPAVGDWFRFHTELGPSPTPEGLFRNLVESTQASGERPTAAFPSSHVGVSTILMLLLWRNRRALMLAVLPLYVLLCASTVYIEAHYLIDVFGGLASAFLFFRLANRLYPLVQRNSINP